MRKKSGIADCNRFDRRIDALIGFCNLLCILHLISIQNHQPVSDFFQCLFQIHGHVLPIDRGKKVFPVAFIEVRAFVESTHKSLLRAERIIEILLCKCQIDIISALRNIVHRGPDNRQRQNRCGCF